MPVIVIKEGGTGLANANSYADINDALTRIENSGRDKDANWLKSTSDAKRASLIVATEYMDDTYRDRFIGQVVIDTQDTQALLWPREGLLLPSGAVRDPLQIPVDIVDACIEFAFALVSSGETDLQPTPTADPSGRSVKRKLVRVEGAVTKDTEFDGGTGAPKRRKYPAAERILRRWICPVFNTVIRA